MLDSTSSSSLFLPFNIHHAVTRLTIPAALYWLGLLLLPILLLLRQQCLSGSAHPRGCRKLGLSPENSNLHDEYDPKYSQGVSEKSTAEDGRPAWRIKALFAYPIKSCAGVELDIADVIPTGFTYDRQFCFAEYVVPKPNPSVASPDQQQQPHWVARTMRDGELSKLALVRPEIWLPDPSAPDYSPDLDEVKSNGVMIISYPRFTRGPLHSSLLSLATTLGLLPKHLSFQVPLYPPREDAYPCTPVKIWKDSPFAYDYGHHLPATLREFLVSDPSPKSTPRGPLTLFRVNPSHLREIFRCAPRKEDIGFQTVTGFADAYPLHLLNLASIHDLARRCTHAIPRLTVRRFRANIIVQGPPAFAEDHWKRIRVGPAGYSATRHDAGAEIYTVCRTMRCRLPNVDPDTGVRHRSEPDRAMKSYRRIDPGDFTNAALGMQLVPVPREFALRVGDSLEVLETGEHFYIKMLAPGEKVEGV
ncbi:hypothetical protein FE257_004684 [Aspergillus nanangensis]|uniref:MOSC domain-containing protein n=1 Tax=Aspergillus nanangensis TaxID=2582783 RepID=A0AAD4CYY3_ASPNN|nr:hypothetical protein FE257_004684 [Aspergillus nanangensis]